MKNLLTTLMLIFAVSTLPANAANLREGMIPTEDFAAELNGEQAIDREQLVETMVSLGVTAGEASERVNSFSDAELIQLGQTGKVQTGAGGIYIGSGVLLLAIILILVLR